MAAPLPVARIEAAARRLTRALLWVALPVVALAALIGGGRLAWQRWSERPELLTPRYRAEALCFALTQPPAFAPKVSIESGTAMIRGRFNAHTPAAVAVREAMGLGDEMITWERASRVGEYEVVAMWLRLPVRSGARHWLIVAWMEGSDLATLSFRFAGDDVSPSAEERQWGDRLLERILVPENFSAGSWPAATWSAPREGALPSFGPAAKRSPAR